MISGCGPSDHSEIVLGMLIAVLGFDGISCRDPGLGLGDISIELVLPARRRVGANV